MKTNNRLEEKEEKSLISNSRNDQIVNFRNLKSKSGMREITRGKEIEMNKYIRLHEIIV